MLVKNEKFVRKMELRLPKDGEAERSRSRSVRSDAFAAPWSTLHNLLDIPFPNAIAAH